jgi:hypothetical protein
VLNRFDFGEPAYETRCVNVPCTVVPFDVIEATWPAFTCCRKNGLYGTRTRGGAFVSREAT